MYLGENKDQILADNHKKKDTILPTIRTYLAAVLLVGPSFQIQSEDIKNNQKDIPVGIYEDRNESTESTENMARYEAIFKDGIRKAINPIQTLNQIPLGGKNIEYDRDEGNIKEKKIASETVKKLNLPEKFDINPKVVKKPISSIIFTLGDRKFKVTPIVGKIENIYLNTDALVIEGSALFDIFREDIIYDRNNKLPDLMFRLWMTSPGKGKKTGFKGVTIEEF
ncbi:MAG: hypothetical protein WC010_04030 [Candidatus Absconditabacterales bacterium]